MMIKTYKDFLNESLTKNDIYPYMFKGMLDVLKEHRDDKEYMDVKKEDGTLAITVSSVPEKTIRELASDITFFILPDNFKPNVAVSMDTSAYRKGTSIEKFQFLKSEKIVEMAKEFYRMIKGEPGYDDITSLYLIIKY